jgi:alpha-beta hydrolase superfamily lysophospholipase
MTTAIGDEVSFERGQARNQQGVRELLRKTLWFGPGERPLFGRLYLPEGDTARAGVVLCPPIGFDAWRAGRAYRALSEQLCNEGFVVLHFDYDGTGDSAGSETDPGRVDAWERSISVAVDFMRTNGSQHVSLVGMRLGATLAASASQTCRPDALILWDPCFSGRSYLREQTILRATYDASPYRPATSSSAVGASHNGATAVETLGAVYGPDTALAMSELSIGTLPAALSGRVLALLRPESPPRQTALEQLSSVGAELADAIGQQEMLDMKPEIFVPQGSLGTMVAWLSRNVGEDYRTPISFPTHETTVIAGPNGTAIVEEVKQWGPNQLFGILARPEGEASTSTVVLLNAGLIDHTGPGRFWVEIARSWAEMGLPVLRVDLSGRGDSPARRGQQLDVVYSPEALEDVADIVEAVSPGHPSAVILVGLCSGAFHAVRAGLDVDVGCIMAINPIFSGRLRDSAAPRSAAEPLGARRAATATGRGARTVARRALSTADDLLTGVSRRVPDEMRSWFTKRLNPGLRASQVFQRLVSRGVDTVVICGRNEGRVIRIGEEGALRRLEKRPGFYMGIFPSIDHSLFARAARDQVLPLLTQRVIPRYAPSSR